MLERPTLYFRRKDNGTVIYRVETGEHSRLDFQQIAILKQNGEVKPSGKQQLRMMNWLKLVSGTPRARLGKRLVMRSALISLSGI